MKLLYLDDDEVDHMAFSRIVRKFPSIQLYAARDLPAAKDIIQQTGPDIILTDYYLGVEKLDEFAHQFDHQPFFVISGKEELENEAELRKAGMIRSFRKPITEEQISQLLEWFGENTPEEEAAPKFEGSYLDYLSQGDDAFKMKLLDTLTAELASVLVKLKGFIVKPDKDAFLLLVHQLKYKTTLLNGEETLELCRQIEEELQSGDNKKVPEMALQLYNAVIEMKAFADNLIAES